MALIKAETQTLTLQPFEKIGKDWMLISAGTPEKWNTMTASWGNIGVMWGKPLATAFVRQSRYTHTFMEQNDRFTLTFLKDGYRQALNLLGSKSGRDMDKMKESGLTPIQLEGQPSFAEASLVLVCEKRYVAPLSPENFINQETLDRWYGDKDYHTMYMGEILACYTEA